MQTRFALTPFIFLIIATFVVISVAEASSLAIRTHLTEATQLNHDRAPLYAKLTSNKSLKLSQELILMENLAKVATLHLDLQTIDYTKNGVGLFHDDLVEMKLTPAFSETFPNEESPKTRVEIEIKNLKRRWLDLINNDELETVYQEAVNLLDEGALREKNQNCLTKHFVESIARGLMNYEGHLEKSRSSGLADPKAILLTFLKIQIHSLGWTKRLDRKAFPLQYKGVPIFCQDVPQIPYK
ncbi:MAG: hypothetical protein K2Q18_15710 [Bdellovibrionales bacterium]|nr:hypothetical protein [Bdellovibrionales bacterium]